MWSIFKVFIEFGTLLLLFYIVVFFDCKVYGILVPWPGIKLSFPALEGEVLTTGSLRESLKLFLISSIVALCFAFPLVFSKVF